MAGTARSATAASPSAGRARRSRCWCRWTAPPTSSSKSARRRSTTRAPPQAPAYVNDRLVTSNLSVPNEWTTISSSLPRMLAVRGQSIAARVHSRESSRGCRVPGRGSADAVGGGRLRAGVGQISAENTGRQGRGLRGCRGWTRIVLGSPPRRAAGETGRGDLDDWKSGGRKRQVLASLTVALAVKCPGSMTELLHATSPTKSSAASTRVATRWATAFWSRSTRTSCSMSSGRRASMCARRCACP